MKEIMKEQVKIIIITGNKEIVFENSVIVAFKEPISEAYNYIVSPYQKLSPPEKYEVSFTTFADGVTIKVNKEVIE